jgi:ATP-binding cassette subfamily A (ABC1) protein 3
VTKDEKAEIVAMTVPMKIPAIVKDPFAFMLSLIAPYFFMLMYIPLLYRTTYRIVSEKELRVRETMRMMGMQDSSYWVSWFAYYTFLNTILSTIAWSIIAYGVFRLSSQFAIFCLIWLYG